MLRKVVLRILLGLALAVAGWTATNATVAPAAHADGCYTWPRTLHQGMRGGDVAQLQVRIAGWAAYRDYIAIDGVFGSKTKAALTRFQRAYRLTADGVAGRQTYAKIYALQDNDCTPVHFSYAELNRCNSTWSGGAVSAARAKANALRVMWQLEALRHQLGDHPLTVVSGFRSYACNRRVGGAASSQHLYGNAADLVSRYASLCTIARQARNAGFSGIFGPGYPGHSDHVHVDRRVVNNDDRIPNRFTWSASTCRI
jgi:zinc D-Ala-D-Ala carboxypeptidase